MAIEGNMCVCAEKFTVSDIFRIFSGDVHGAQHRRCHHHQHNLGVNTLDLQFSIYRPSPPTQPASRNSRNPAYLVLGAYHWQAQLVHFQLRFAA